MNVCTLGRLFVSIIKWIKKEIGVSLMLGVNTEAKNIYL